MKADFEKDNLKGTFTAAELEAMAVTTCNHKGYTIAFSKPVNRDGKNWTRCSVWEKEGRYRNRLFGTKRLIACDDECLNEAIAWARKEIEAL